MLKAFWAFAPTTDAFVRGFADITRPLYRLTEAQREFRWTRECEDTFCQLKCLLTTAPILAFPRLDGLFILDTDASNTGLGAVLSQIQGDEEKVIAFHSKSLNKSERNYCVTCKELLAVIVADLPPLLVWKAISRLHRPRCFEMAVEVHKSRGTTRQVAGTAGYL